MFTKQNNLADMTIGVLINPIPLASIKLGVVLGLLIIILLSFNLKFDGYVPRYQLMHGLTRQVIPYDEEIKKYVEIKFT